MLLFDGGVCNDALWDVVLCNVRDPESVEGDLTAQLSACRRGVERLRELAARHGAATLRVAAADLIDDTSARADGVAGGGPGTPASVQVGRAGGAWETLPYDTSALMVRRGDVVRLTAAGGGGHGEPIDSEETAS